ncbi:MAG: DUF885 domain-containing protein [Theionarchaea archaeon]|nr:DUF885 domain-containing protein [Theionarchaea archaeon]
MKKESYLSMLLIIFLLGGCIGQSQEPMPSNRSELAGLPIDEFFEESYRQLLLRSPEQLTALGMSESFGLRNDTLNDLSDEYTRETQRLQVEILSLLHSYDRSTLTPDQQISYDVYEWLLDDMIRGHEFMYYAYPVHHFIGSYDDELVRLFTEYHTLNSSKDAQDYVSRLSKVDTQVGQVIERLKSCEEAGVIPPKFIIEWTKGNLYNFINFPSLTGDGNILYTNLSEKIQDIDMDEDEKQTLLDTALTEIEGSIYPAFQLLIEYLDYLVSVSTFDAGVWKFPDGDAYYQYMLRHETSTDLTPEEIHQLGLSEVERIRGEMEAVFDELGYDKDLDFSDKVGKAVMDGGMYLPISQEGRDEVVSAYETILAEVDERLVTVFDIHPAMDLIVVPELSYGGGGGYYVSGSADGTRPGAFHTGVGNSTVYKYLMPTIAYHEGIPGHHFQISIAQEQHYPLFRNDIILNGYAEGWALYAERLAWEIGMYEEDPYGNIGRLEMELLRAVRLVVDTGIHYKRWTREEAQAYMREAMGTSMHLHEVERYIVLPAQATGYKVGMIEMLELRQRARDALGDRFDIKEFHKLILMHNMPFELLDNVVDEYIAAKLEGSYTIGLLSLA